MLTNDAILQRGRYRVIRLIASIGDDCLYVAQDNVLFNEVIMRETSVGVKTVSTLAEHEALNTQFTETAKSLSTIDHPSIVGIRNYFFEGNEHYLVTEPIAGTSVLETETPRDRMSGELVALGADEMLAALKYLREFAPTFGALAIRPEYLWLTPDSRLRLLFFGPLSKTHDRTDFGYQPLESVWTGLDQASQNVISHSYDDRALEILEQPADIRSDIYSLGAALYHLSTGCKPIDALERSIEILDEKPDPLSSPTTLIPEMSEKFAAFLIKSLELRRENRFQSAEEARGFLPPELIDIEPQAVYVFNPADESELLEIPAVTGLAPIAGQTYGFAATEPAINSAFGGNDIADLKLAESSVTAFSEVQDLDNRDTDDGSPVDDVFEGIVLDDEPDNAVSGLAEPIFSAGAPLHGNRFFRPVPITIVAVLVLGGAAWGVLTMTDSKTRRNDDALQMSVDAMRNEPVTAPSANLFIATATPEQDTVKEPANIQEPEPGKSTELAPSYPNSPVQRSRPQIADAKPLRRNENQPAEKVSPKPKKRVTVDDLIGGK